MNSTKLIGKIFVPRQKEIDLYGTKAEEIQARVFRKLIHKASATEWGMRYDNNHLAREGHLVCQIIWNH